MNQKNPFHPFNDIMDDDPVIDEDVISDAVTAVADLMASGTLIGNVSEALLNYVAVGSRLATWWAE